MIELGYSSEVLELTELLELLTLYGELKFGDEWWPGAPEDTLDEKDAKRLKDLLNKAYI